MTLVVARIETGRISIAADTMITEHKSPLPLEKWVLKSKCLPGGICVSYSGSPELAARTFREFRANDPQSTSFTSTVEFFERSSTTTNNDYIVAFSTPAKLVTIRDGHRRSGASKTHWIGDKDAYERFREFEHRNRKKFEHNRAVNAVLFADEMKGSPASDLYSIMRNLLQDRELPSVGGFVTVVSNRDKGFRFSVYSDILLDWPMDLNENQSMKLTDKFDLRSSGENDRYSISQISPGHNDMNIVAFYHLSGRLLVVFYEDKNGEANCFSVKNVEPSKIASTLDEKLGFPFKAMCLVMSSRKEFAPSLPRVKPEQGLALSLYCEVTTFSEMPLGPIST